MTDSIYECVAVFDDPGGPYVAVLSEGGDTFRVECPQHRSPFLLGGKYRLTVEKCTEGRLPCAARNVMK